MEGRRPSSQTAAALSAFLERPGEWLYGYDLSKRLRLSSGTLYPILMRLSDRGYLETEWTEPAKEGRPPRHMYRLTAAGRIWATEALSEAKTPTRAIHQPLTDPG